MKPTKVTRAHVCLPRYWTGYFYKRPDQIRFGSDLLRGVTLVQSFETKKDAEEACKQLRREYPSTWGNEAPDGRVLEVFDMAEFRFDPAGHERDHADMAAYYDEYARDHMGDGST